MSPASADGEYAALALEKMGAVLGPARARELYTQLCERHRLTLKTADDLYRFGAALAQLGGFEGAVGALLTVRAVMNGASPHTVGA